MPAFSGVEINNQIRQINIMLDSQITEAQNIKKNIYNFINNDELQSEAYANQKNYFNIVYISLYNGIEQFSKEFMSANKRLQRQYLQVDNDTNAYINTDILVQEVGNLNSIVRYWMNLVVDLPYAEYYANLNGNLANKIQGVIERMDQFTWDSRSNYETTKTYLDIVTGAMKQLRKDYWDPITGTFDCSKINVDWINAMNRQLAIDELKAEGFTEKDINNMESKGVDVIGFCSTYKDRKENGTSEDLEMLKLLASGNYEDAFAMDPELLSEDIIVYLSSFVSQVYIHDYSNRDKDSEFSNYLEIQGALLKSDTYYPESNQFTYLRLITATQEKILEKYAENLLCIELTAEERTEIANEMGRIMEMININLTFASLATASVVPGYENMSYKFERGFEIDKFSYDGNGNISMDVYELYTKTSNSIPPRAIEGELSKGPIKNINTSFINTDIENENLAYKEFLDQLEKDKERLAVNVFISGAAVLGVIFCPAAAPYISIITGATSLSGSKITKSSLDVASKQYSLNPDDITMTKNLIDFLVDGHALLNNDSDKKLKEYDKEVLAKLFGNDKFLMTIGDNSTILKEGMYDPQNLVLMYCWSEQGISAFVNESMANNLKDACSDISTDPVVKKILDGDFTWGEDFTMEEFLNAMVKIDDAYQTMVPGEYASSASIMTDFATFSQNMEFGGFEILE